MEHAKDVLKCPNCGASIDVSEVLYSQLKEQLQAEFAKASAEKETEMKAVIAKMKQREDEISRKESELEEAVERKVSAGLKKELEAREKLMKKKLDEENAEFVSGLRKELEEKSDKLRELNKTKAELERLKRDKDELAERISMEKEKEFTGKLNEERMKLRKLAEEESHLKMKEREKIIEDLKSQLDEARRKAEQGSMQLQGEVQELAIEDFLRKNFPLDSIEEIKKGARGADCVQTVNTHSRSNCGVIYYESKRTKDFQPSWIEKFKEDMRSIGAGFGVLVTNVLPKDWKRMGQKDGIWICTFEEFKALCFVIRESVVMLGEAVATQENKGDKMNMLYDYLTGNEFRQQIESIVEGFVQMNEDLESEKRAMQGIWKKREKQIRKVLLNTNHMYHSVKGIAGTAIGTIKVLELPSGDEVDGDDED